MTLWRLFVEMILAGLAAVGGGSGTVAVAQDVLVVNGLLDPGLFAWSVALGHLTPGPLSTSVVGMGYFVRGIPGAILAIVGVNIPTWVGSIVAMRGLDLFRHRLTPIFRPAGFVVAGLGIATAVRTAVPLQIGILDLGAIAVVAYIVGWRKVDPVWVLGGAITIGSLLLFVK